MQIGPVTRASRVDFDEITTNLAKMESDCKVSWDHLRVIAKHDGPTNLKLKYVHSLFLLNPNVSI